ncbi:MAG: ABC transporter permease, partial [Acidobacteriota bacterium]
KVKTGKINYRIKVKSDLASTSLVMFRCLQTDVARVFNPRNMGYLTKAELFDTRTEAAPLRYWYSRVDGRDTMAVSVFLEKGTRFKLTMAESLLGRELLLLNGSPEEPEGKGFLIGEPIPFATLQAAKDMRFLVGKRLQNLFEHGIVNRHLESLFKTAESELDLAAENLSANELRGFWDRAVSAWARLDSVYSEIENTQRDVLGGVMFFIALFVPFAYCMERYLFAHRNVYRQIAAFLAILVLTIMAVRALHPAFQLTYSPMVVIIAFFIVGLSLLVSWIIFMRFESEMAELHSRTAHLRTPQASKWQSFGAGFAIGVSNLNRRKLRTGLTCVTLIILTFTVMSFTNVKSLSTTTSTRLAENTPYRGILLRHQYRMALTPLTLEGIQAQFATGPTRVWPKAWIEPETFTGVFTVAHCSGGSGGVEGVLGLGADPPERFKTLLTHGRWFEPGEQDAVILPHDLAVELKLDPQKDLGADVTLMGGTFRVVGFFDDAVMETTTDLDLNPIMPAYMEVNRSEEASEAEIEAMQSGEEILPQAERFRYADADRTVIIPFERCLDYGGVLKTVSIVAGPEASPLKIADGLASWLAFPLFVGDEGVWYHSASTTVRYQGVANLFVPILIVIFITLNTMIGHVHERQKEIATYTSVGLAPTHVGFLFIVEALSMAVISTVIGYILAQLSARYLGNTAAFSQLTFNYSSLASVACMFLVFAVVFLAALYPARMASELAMPDVNRSWSLPEPQGDTIFMNLPFLLKHEEETGVMGFLNSFYTSYQDVGHGSFIVDETQLDVDAPRVKPGEFPMPVCLLIRTNIWLAPFDFGIKQHLQLHCCPSPENPGYLEIALVMTRLSGEHSAWARANRNFIKALRKQMLLWRLLDDEAKNVYSGQWTERSA